METTAMGKVLVAVTVENLGDLLAADRGFIPAGQVRRVDVTDALVDTGATFLSLPGWLVGQLGLKRFGTRRVRTSAGVVEAAVCEAVRLTVQGRSVSTDVIEVPDNCPVLIGQIPLEGLDLVVAPVGRRLVGNPDHGGEHMADLF